MHGIELSTFPRKNINTEGEMRHKKNDAPMNISTIEGNEIHLNSFDD